MSVIKAGEDLSNNERDFILTALKTANYRLDGRTTIDTRPVRVTYARCEGQASAEIQLGKTRVLTVVTSEVVPPYPDRPTEGFLNLNVEYSPMAALGVDNARSSPVLVEVDRVIERCLRQSRALDTEALCLIAGQKVWSIRCDVRILDDCGNVIDAACLATVAALLHFRLAEVTVTGQATVMVHHSFDKEPTALPIHHVPICVSVGLFHEGILAAVDPTHREEAVMGGRITYCINIHKELCALQKIGGLPLSPLNIMKWCQVATAKVGEWHTLLETSLAEADKRAKEERLKRVRGTASVDRLPLQPAPPPAAREEESIEPPSEYEGEGEGGNEGIKHLDFATLHVPIKVREESEKERKGPSLEEKSERLRLLEKAAEDTEKYNQERQASKKQEERKEEEARRRAAASAAVAQEAKEKAEEEEMEVVVEGEKEKGGKKGRNGGSGTGRKKGKEGRGKADMMEEEEDNSEEEETGVVVSEFSTSTSPFVSAAAVGDGSRKGGGGGGGGSSLAARRSRISLEGNDEEEEEEEREGLSDDLVHAVKKPRREKAGWGGRGGGKGRRKVG